MPTTLMTGANRGIGLEFVRQYAADGWNVIACVRNPAKADTLKTLANKNIRIEALDVTDEKSIASLADKLKGTAIDLLINNAGIFSGTGRKGSNFPDDGDDESQTFGSIDPESWDKVLRTNTIAPVMMAQAFASLLARNGNGKIVMITSRMGSIEEASEGDIAYRTSKAALNAAMHNIALSLKSDKITVASVHPGWVKTDMGGARATLTPEASVTGMRKVIAGLSLDKTGQFLSYDGKTIAW